MDQTLFSWTNFIVIAIIALTVLAVMVWAAVAIAHRVRQRGDASRRTAAVTRDDH